jgi:hypothetical protein
VNDLDLLRKAALANPDADLPLLMLADELQAAGEDSTAAEARAVVELRALVREVEADLAALNAAMVAAERVADERRQANEELEAAIVDALMRSVDATPPGA